MSAPLFDIHTHLPAPEGVVSVCAYEALGGGPLPVVPYTTGIHPWRVDSLREADRPREALLQSITERTVGIGETGLDYVTARDDEARQRQRTWFRWQMEVAQQHRFPAVIHCVKAYNDVLTALPDFTLPAVIIHGFTGSPELAKQMLVSGCYLSFGQNLLRSPKTAEALRITPNDRLFLESDTGPASIETIYARAADLIGRPENELREIVYANYTKIFSR